MVILHKIGCLTALLLSLFPAGCPKSSPRAGDPWFEEVAAKANLHFTHETGHIAGRFWMPEIAIGGVGLLDYDGDGDLDVYCVQGGSLSPDVPNPAGNRLFRNLGDGTFEDVTEAAGVGDNGYGMGCACADYDGDGHVDLYVTNVGANVLYRNNGDGTFTDVTSVAGVGDESWSASCAFVDYNGDGHVDLLIANYIRWSPEREITCHSRGGLRDYCGPMSYQAPAFDMMYRNRGDGTFEDVTAAVGLHAAYGNGLGVACGDYNQDGQIDLYVANDGMPNQLWINSGGRFTDEAMFRACAVNWDGMAEAGMGVMAVDIQQDGQLDLFMTHLMAETNTLYVNNDGYFQDATVLTGLSASSLSFTGFGVGLADFDHDGYLDLYVTNGKVKYGQEQYAPNDPYAEPDQLFRGRNGVRFEEVMPRGGAFKPLIASGRGAAFGDLDNDGDIDILVVNRDAPIHLMRNIVGGRGHWIMFRVLNKLGIDALGAVLEIRAAGHRQFRLVQTAYSYCASNDPRAHFGIGDADHIDHVRVRWPGGWEERFGPFDADRIYELREGTGKPPPVD